MTRTEELQAALDALEQLMKCFNWHSGYDNEDKKMFHKTIRTVLEHAIAKASVTCIEREELIDKMCVAYWADGSKPWKDLDDAFKNEMRGGMQDVLDVVSNNAGKPVNHSPDVGNMVWQPIATAPKDGTRIRCLMSTGDEMILHWEPEYADYAACWCDDCSVETRCQGVKEVVIEKWNTRTDIHEAEVKRLREALKTARHAIDAALGE